MARPLTKGEQERAQRLGASLMHDGLRLSGVTPLFHNPRYTVEREAPRLSPWPDDSLMSQRWLQWVHLGAQQALCAYINQEGE
jgi:hypothetical protein